MLMCRATTGARIQITNPHSYACEETRQGLAFFNNALSHPRLTHSHACEETRQGLAFLNALSHSRLTHSHACEETRQGLAFLNSLTHNTGKKGPGERQSKRLPGLGFSRPIESNRDQSAHVGAETMALVTCLKPNLSDV